MVLTIVVAITAKRVPLDTPEILPWLRGFFFASNIGVFGCCLAIHWKIRRNGSFVIPYHTLSATNTSEVDTTPLLYTDAAEQQAQEASPSKQMTVYAHDRNFLSALYKLPVKGFLVVALMHFYMKSTKPLLLQSVLPLKALWEADIFRVHVRGHAATGELQRPWKKRRGPRQLVTECMGFAVRIWKGEQTKRKSA